MTSRRVALVTTANFYVGPDTARILARRGHDLVVGDADPDLVTELESYGATVVNVDGGSRARTEIGRAHV